MVETSTAKKRKGAPVLNIESLSVAYKVRGGEIEAVQDVSFDIFRGKPDSQMLIAHPRV